MTLAARRDAIQAVRLRIMKQARRAPANAIYRSPFEYDWSIGLILHHLIASERHFIAELMRNLKRPAPNFEPEEVVQRPFNALLEGLAGTRAVTLRTLSDVKDADAARPLKFSSHPLLIGRSGLELIDFMAMHENRHGDEIDDILARLEAAH